MMMMMMMMMIVWNSLADNGRVCFTLQFYTTRPDVSIYKAPLAASFSPFLILLFPTQLMACGVNESMNGKTRTQHRELHALLFFLLSFFVSFLPLGSSL